MSGFKQRLIAAFAPKIVPFSVETDGEKLEGFVRELSAAQVFDFQKKQKLKEGDQERFICLLISETVCDEQGNKEMTYDEVKEAMAVKVQAFNKLAEVISVMSGLTQPPKKEGDEAKNV